MIAYNKIWLDNLIVRESIEEVFFDNAITTEEKEAAEKVYPVGFYTPNIFIRTGLFVLTIIIACFSLGLLSLLFLSNIENNFGGLILFFGFLCYAFLEFFVQAKNHCRSGVDDALLWITGICIVSGINIISDVSSSTNAFIIFVLASYFFVRFTDMLMSAIAGVAFLGVFFFNYINLGSFGRATVPFLIMTIAAVIYFFIKRSAQQSWMRYYRHCRMVVEIVMLICFYAAANYYVVREVGNSMLGLGLKDNEDIPYGWLFWTFTIIIPVLYILRGMQKKDIILIRVGLILIAAIVFTVRYYHSILPLETVMLLAGAILIVISYALIKYLSPHKKGYTSAESDRYRNDKLNIEALVIAETFGNTTPASDTKFGGGSFGGGGASGEY